MKRLLLGIGISLSLLGRSTDEVFDLKEAIQEGNYFKVKQLFDQGLSIVDALMEGYLPLHHGVEAGYDDIAELLIRKGALVNAPAAYNRTPLHKAAINNDYRLVKLLLSRGADVTAQDAAKQLPVDFAHAPKVNKLLKNAQEYKENRLSYTSINYLKKASPKTLKKAFFFASLLGDVPILQQLRDSEMVDPNMPLDEETGLLLAARYDHPEAASLFLNWKGINLKAKDKKGRTALYLAIKTGDPELVEPLLKAVNPSLSERKELASLATVREYKELTNLLIG